MKKLISILAALTVLPLLAPAAEPVRATTSAPKTDADLAYEAMYANWRKPAPEGLTRKDRAFWEHQDKTMREFSAAARAFAEKFPTNPRRYDGIIQSSFTRPWFLSGFKPEFEARPSEANLVVDQPALNAWRASQLQLLAAIIESPDATTRQRGGAMYCYLIDSRSDARDRGVPFDLAAVTALVDRVVSNLPDERALPVVDQYLTLLKEQSPEGAKAYAAKLQSIPPLAQALAAAEEKRQQAAAEKQKKLTALTALKFTAADGREVNIAALKGKVVLIDFWATWCGPCIAEIPNVVANYKKYHDKGFEVVGITLENPGVIAKDAPAEVVASKMDAAKKKMLDFTVKNGMPWPQYFDGKYWQNDYAKQFGVNAIPAMFLLDQEGRVVSTEARGPKLEAELKRLLKL